jgi:hypothetical protein
LQQSRDREESRSDSPALDNESGSQLAVAKPVQTRTGGATPRRTKKDGTDNINEAHNNYAVLTQTTTRNVPMSNMRTLYESPPGMPSHGVRVVRLKVAIDKRLTSIDERSPSVLKYKTPHFR